VYSKHPEVVAELTTLMEKSIPPLCKTEYLSVKLSLIFLPILLLTFTKPTASAAETADLVVRSANVITIDAAHPRAQAFAVTGGKFTIIGANDAVASYIGPQTTVLDLSGKTVTPGFIDAHAHPMPIYPEDSVWAPVDCRPQTVKNIEGLIAALKRKAEKTPSGKWIVGENYENLKLERQPTRWDLDRASTQNPILLRHYSGHERVCNSLALKLAKITKDIADPPGGRFVRDEKGELTGLMEENAALNIATGETPPDEEVDAGYTRGYRQFLSRGVTTVGVAWANVKHARDLERARTGDAPLRLYIAMSEGLITETLARKQAMKSDENGVRYGAIKIFHGGSVSAHTCWVSEPYIGVEKNFGLKPSRSQETLNKVILAAHKAGLQIWVHCNGDREIDMVVTAFENALKIFPRPDHRHRLEHCSVVTPELLRRIKSAGLVVIPHSYIWEHGDILDAYNPKLWETILPSKSLLDLGISRAAHSDSPVSTSDPLMHIQALVTRTSAQGKTYGLGQRITPEQAITVWTLGGAFACFSETQTGSITAGKLADFVILDGDPTTVVPDQIRKIAVEATFVGGREVFARRSRDNWNTP